MLVVATDLLRKLENLAAVAGCKWHLHFAVAVAADATVTATFAVAVEATDARLTFGLIVPMDGTAFPACPLPKVKADAFGLAVPANTVVAAVAAAAAVPVMSRGQTAVQLVVVAVAEA